VTRFGDLPNSLVTLAERWLRQRIRDRCKSQGSTGCAGSKRSRLHRGLTPQTDRVCRQAADCGMASLDGRDASQLADAASWRNLASRSHGGGSDDDSRLAPRSQSAGSRRWPHHTRDHWWRGV